jgi:DNA-binding transcriptional LysR family regulator
MRFNGFDLNQALCLDALLNERSVSRAAARVHLSQSAMSAVLAQLRDYFHDPLLVRSGRKLVLTPFAQTLVGPVGDFLASAHALTALTPNQAPTDVDRELRIAASDFSVQAFLAIAIQQLAAQMPGLRFDVLPLTNNSGAALKSGELDIVFAGQVLNVGLPPSELLLEDRFVCVVCKAHGIKAKKISARQYIGSDHVVMRYFEHRLAFEDEEALRRQGLTRRQRVAVSSVNQIAPLIVGTRLIGTVPQRIATTLVERWPLRLMPFPFEQEPIRHYAYWHESRVQDPVIARFMDAVRAVAASN